MDKNINLEKRNINENKIEEPKENLDKELEKAFDIGDKNNKKEDNNKGLFGNLASLGNNNGNSFFSNNSTLPKASIFDNIGSKTTSIFDSFNTKSTLFNNNNNTSIFSNMNNNNLNNNNEESEDDKEEIKKNDFDFKKLKENDNIKSDFEEIISFEVMNFKIDEKSSFGKGLVSIEKNKKNDLYFIIFRNVFKVLYSGFILKNKSKIITIKNKEDILSGFTFNIKTNEKKEEQKDNKEEEKKDEKEEEKNKKDENDDKKEFIKNNFKIQFSYIENAEEFKKEFTKLI